jgi:hypothetical protein
MIYTAINMSAKEKASELIVNFQIKCKSLDYNEAKQCSLITVNEILIILFQHHEIDYWKEVKKEIENL